MTNNKKRNITKDYMNRLKKHISLEFPEIDISSIQMIDDGGLYDRFVMEFRSPYIKLRKSMEIESLERIE